MTTSKTTRSARSSPDAGHPIQARAHACRGRFIPVGARTFANSGLIALDVAPIVIGDDVWLGGVSIGEGTVVGAVVTRDLPANVVAVGNPARVVREI